jgi:hypothetical protein
MTGTDFMTWYNSGLVEIDTNVRINADTEIFGHNYGSAGVETNKASY